MPRAQLQSSGLRLDNQAGAMKGGYSGPVIQPGSSSGKLIHLQRALTERRSCLPFSQRLTAEEIGLLCARGSIRERTGHLSLVRRCRFQMLASPRIGHSKPVRRPELSYTRNRNWAHNPIDYFVLARFERKGIKSITRSAENDTDPAVIPGLTGLPPSPADVNEFLTDTLNYTHIRPSWSAGTASESTWM